MKTNIFYWHPKQVSEELHTMCNELGSFYPLQKIKTNRTNKTNTPSLQIVKSDNCAGFEAVYEGATVNIRYRTTAHAGRALGTVLSGLVPPRGVYREESPFLTFGIMLDCSRNAVMTVDHVKLWLRRLALLGYNMVMLYTEETYVLDGEPWFGFQRGAYTASELKDIDAYAAALNIEVIPCIQTLGHLANLLRHPAYEAIKDTASVMMVGEEKTYTLIEKMITHWRSVLRTRRIHIGMDETHDLGRGKYLDRNGYKRGFDLFNEHLAKVVDICKAHSFTPMIWSDMYFRLGNPAQNYYERLTVIPKDVIDKIPDSAELVYWDYYHMDKDFYLDWIQRHRAMGKEPLMGSGIWTWNRYWYDWRLTEYSAGPCIDASRESGLKEIFFTQWGDNGAYCDHDSAFAGMVWCAEKAYTRKIIPEHIESRFSAVCGGSYSAHRLAGDIHSGTSMLRGKKWHSPYFTPDMWDDPFFETKIRLFFKDNPQSIKKQSAFLHSLAQKLFSYINENSVGNMRYAYCTAKALAMRYSFSADLLGAYRKKDKKKLAQLKKSIPAVQKSIAGMSSAFRVMWMSHNKPQGIETIQARFGMLSARYAEISLRLGEYLAGKVKDIPELAEKCPKQ